MDDQRVQTDESPELPEVVASAPRGAGGGIGGVVVSLGLVSALLVSIVLALDGFARYAFQGQDSSASLTRAIVVMSIALGVPIAAIVGWAIRHRHLAATGRPHRRGVLVTAGACLLLGLPSIWLVTGAVKQVEHDAVVSFQRSLDAADVEAEGIAHLEWMAASLTLDVLGEPEITRESCVLADGSRGAAPTVVIRAQTGRVATEDLVRVALSFWTAEGYDPHEGEGRMAYISGTALEDPYVEILFIADATGAGGHELSYHAVCMTPASSSLG